MTYAANYRDFGSCFRDKDSTKSGPDANKPGILRRIFGAIFETRQEQIEREVARFVARCGGRITDDIERQIMQHFFTSNCGTLGSNGRRPQSAVSRRCAFGALGNIGRQINER